MNIIDILFAKKLSGGGSPFPPVIKRVTGNPIEFTDGADAPLVKCVTAITGSQDLHGQDKPWVGGAGKNKLPQTTTGTQTINGITFTPNDDGSVKVTGTATGTANYTYIATNASSPLKAGNWRAYASGLSNVHFVIGGQQSSFTGVTLIEDGYTDFTLANDNDTLGYCIIQVASGVTVNSTVHLMITSPNETSTFTPYSNICPITAYTEGGIEVRGKNLLQTTATTATVNGITYTVKDDGSIYYKGTSVGGAAPFTINAHCPVKSSYGEIKITKGDTPNIVWRNIILYDENGNSLYSTANPPEVIDLSNYPTASYFSLEVKRNSDIYCEGTIYPMIRFANITEDTYEPYTSTTHSTTYPSAIYRGSEDVVNGTETHDMVKVVFDGSSDESWNLQSINSYGIANFQIALSSTGRIFRFLCNYLTVQDTLISVTTTEGFFANETTFFVRLSSSRASTVAELQTWLSNNPLELMYEVAPTTSSVTPTNLPIKSLSGYNHIESSTGEMVVDYITEGYQNFVDTVESALPNTRKGGVKAFDIFKTLDEPKTPEASVEEKQEEEVLKK